MAFILLMGFSSGLPLMLTGSTLQAWMKSENIDLAVIGLYSLVGLPYALKFLWAPFMDRYVPPFLGRRRGWMLICQLALVLTIALMALLSPKREPVMTALLAVAVAFFSASQDIVVDAYKPDLLSEKEFGFGAALSTMGYRIAILFSGALALVLADYFPWRTVYLLMAMAMGVGICSSFFAPEPEKILSPRTMKDAIVLPFVEFFKRRGAVEVLIFIVLYKLDVVMATALTTPFMLELGFTKTDIGTVTKFFGFFASIAGTLVGGAWMMKLGLRKSLLYFGLAQGISNLSFMWLAHVGHNYSMMVSAIAIENFCSGMGLSAFAAFMMSLCDRRFTATQFALLTSLMALTRVVASAPTGFMVKAMGWESFFLFCTLLAAPGLLLLMRYNRWEQRTA